MAEPLPDCCSATQLADVDNEEFCSVDLATIIPQLQCAIDAHKAFTDYWDVVDLCDPESPYLPIEQWYVSPDTTGINCSS